MFLYGGFSIAMFDYQRVFQRNKQLKLGPCGHWERIDGSPSLFLCLIQLVVAEERVIIQISMSNLKSSVWVWVKHAKFSKGLKHLKGFKSIALPHPQIQNHPQALAAKLFSEHPIPIPVKRVWEKKHTFLHSQDRLEFAVRWCPPVMLAGF